MKAIVNLARKRSSMKALRGSDFKLSAKRYTLKVPHQRVLSAIPQG